MIWPLTTILVHFFNGQTDEYNVFHAYVMLILVFCSFPFIIGSFGLTGRLFAFAVLIGAKKSMEDGE
ncbi:hypothetical protein [Halorubrum ezzemoulense]|uniref:hypothetical protein n=1 Tax=Halorubrum ezzemoulense TaxID=337243 RepID=UPI00232C3620|nr:hypothetical protein [Halorubrum ezzemoulense]MDB2239502.1 hypothetical protein [Halorubrum ezzemoulense]